MLNACSAYDACFAREMPFFSPSGFVSWPYSVIQIRDFLLPLNHLSSDFSKRGSDESETFGQSTLCVGFRYCGVGYGWCAHASNLSRGLACATSCAKRPGECVSDWPFTSLSRPCVEVSPIATFARELPFLIPA
jgi:hypothetical protein